MPHVIIVAIIDQDIGVRSRGALKLKTRRGRLHEIPINLRNPAGKNYTDPCVYTENLRFTAWVNTLHTVLHMVVPVLNSCMCMSGLVHRQVQ